MQCSSHPQAAADFFTKMLHPVPHKRCNAYQAADHPYMRRTLEQMADAFHLCKGSPKPDWAVHQAPPVACSPDTSADAVSNDVPSRVQAEAGRLLSWVWSTVNRIRLSLALAQQVIAVMLKASVSSSSNSQAKQPGRHARKVVDLDAGAGRAPETCSSPAAAVASGTGMPQDCQQLPAPPVQADKAAGTGSDNNGR